MPPDVLGQRRDVAVVDELDPVEFVVDVARGQLLADLARVGEAGPVGEAGVGGADLLLAEGEGRDALAPNRGEGRLGPLLAQLVAQPQAIPDHVGVEGAGQTTVAGDQHHADPLDVLALDQHRHARHSARLLGGTAGQISHPLRIRPQLLNPLLSPAQPRRRNHLHSPRDLVDVLDRSDAVLDVLLTSHSYSQPWGEAGVSRPGAGFFASRACRSRLAGRAKNRTPRSAGTPRPLYRSAKNPARTVLRRELRGFPSRSRRPGFRSAGSTRDTRRKAKTPAFGRGTPVALSPPDRSCGSCLFLSLSFRGAAGVLPLLS